MVTACMQMNSFRTILTCAPFFWNVGLEYAQCTAKGILSWVGHSFDSVRTCVIAIAQMTVENEWSSCRNSAPFDCSSHFPVKQ